MGRVIECATLGDGPRDVLVVSDLAGSSRAPVALADQLAAHLARYPKCVSGASVTIVRDANPDGRARSTASNARGVVLDQNFPTSTWRKVCTGSAWSSGRVPESEPETQVLVQLLSDLKPCRLIVLSRADRPAVHFYGPAEDLAYRVAAKCSAAVRAVDPARAAGSFAGYAGGDQAIPTLVIKTARSSGEAADWNHFRGAILSALVDGLNASGPRAGAGPGGNAGWTGKRDAAGGGSSDRADSAGGESTVAVVSPRAAARAAARNQKIAAGSMAPAQPTSPRAARAGKARFPLIVIFRMREDVAD
jgi:hypothetical protein